MFKIVANIKLKIIIFSLFLLLAGCFNMNVYQTAPVLEKDEHIAGGGINLGLYSEDFLWGSLELHYREGLGHNWDAGAKLYGAPSLFTGINADLKYQLLGPPFYVSSSVFGGIINFRKKFETEAGSMLLLGTKRFYSGYKLHFRDKNLNYGNAGVERPDFLHNFFMGYRFGPGPYITPNVGFIFREWKKRFLSNTFVFGLALQFD